MAANIAEITAKVKKAIAARATETATLAAKYERYKASATGVPIFTRKVASYTKVNNMLNADFVGDVVDTKVGYLVGKPVFVKYTSKAATDDAKKKENDAAAAVIDNFSRLNNLPDIDAETVKIAAVCGWCGRRRRFFLLRSVVGWLWRRRRCGRCDFGGCFWRWWRRRRGWRGKFRDGFWRCWRCANCGR
mgnify:CR=1 FL=1